MAVRTIRAAVSTALALSALTAIPAAAAAAPAPAVTSLAPHRAGNADRPVVAVSGTGFTTGSTVTFGGMPAESTEVRSSTLIYARPPSLAGTVDVRVTTGGRRSPVTAKDEYTVTTPPEEPANTNKNLGFVETDVSCATDGYCLIPGYDDRSVSFTGDTAGPLRSTPGALDVACTSASFCGGRGLGNRAYTFDGEHWTTSAELPTMSPGYSAISCTGRTCLVASTNGTWWRYDGTNWASGTGGPHIATKVAESIDLSCGATAFCVAAVEVREEEGTGGRTQLYRLNGSSWSSPTVFADEPSRSARVSCTSATYCFAETDGGDREWNGSSWTTLTTSPTEGVSWVRCFEPNACLGKGVLVGSGTRDEHLLRYDGTNWSDLGAIPNATPNRLDFDCSSLTACRSLTILDYTRFWRASTGFGPATELWNRLYDVTAMSCAGGAYCVGVSPYGRMGRYDGTWHPSVRIDRVGSPAAVSCTTADRCVVVDDAGYAITITGNGAVLSSVRIDGEPLVSVSCGSNDFCVAIDGTGRIVRFEGGSWHRPTLHAPLGALHTVSCTAPSFCLAVGHGYVTHYQGGGNWWPAKKIATYTRTVVCTSPTYCMVGLKTGIRIWGGQALSPKFTFPNSEYIFGISCPSEEYCIVASNSSIFPATDSAYTALDGTAHAYASLIGEANDKIECLAPRKCLRFEGGDLIAVTQ